MVGASARRDGWLNGASVPMSQVKIIAALETALSAMTPALATSLNNVAYVPPAVSVAYQQAWILFARPENREYGPNYRELGYMQIDLKYPLQMGDGAARARGQLIRETFYNGATFSNDGVDVTVSGTPEVGAGAVDGSRWIVIVKIPFFANIN